MKFDKIIGKCDPELVREAEKKLSAIFAELAMGYGIYPFGSRIGGDIFLHQLITPLKHICDARSIEFDVAVEALQQDAEFSGLSIPEQEIIIGGLRAKYGTKLLYTAATNGSSFFWSPKFVANLSQVGLRLVVGHEAWHCIYMHPSKRGKRIPQLWNIAVDFKVNFTLIEDLRARGFRNPELMFATELGDFITIKEYVDFLKNPFNPPPKLSGWNPINTFKDMLNPGYKASTSKPLYYCDPKLSEEFKQPENIYDYLLHNTPKCNTCGKVGVWHKPEELKKLEQEIT